MKRCLLLIILISNINVSVGQELNLYFSQGQLQEANTAEETLFLSDSEKEVLMCVNLARLFPKSFAKVLLAHMRNTRSTRYTNSLFKSLQSQTSKPAIYPDEALTKTARCWALESGRKGITGHNRYRCQPDYYAECCGYLWQSDGMSHVLNLLIDEGVPSLGHRKILLDEDYHKAGIAMEQHKKYGKVLVVDLK